MDDNASTPSPTPPADGSNQSAKNSKVKSDKKLKPELAKRSLSGAFGTLAVIIGFCIHGLAFWFFVIPGIACLSYCLRLELKHHGYTKNRAIISAFSLLIVGVLGSCVYWLETASNGPTPNPEPNPPQPIQMVFSEFKPYPGFCVHLLLNLGEQAAGRDNFILDTGMADDRDRISIFINRDKNLCFRVIGDDGQPVTLEVSPSINTFQYSNKIWLACDYGMTNDFCFMRMLIDGKKVAENLQASPMVSPLQWLTFNPVLAANAEGVATNHFIIGNDIYSQNSGSFVLSGVILSTNTTDRYMLNTLAKMFTGISVTQPNYVEGTYVTVDDLQVLFPYGYAVIYYSAYKQVTYQIFTNALSDWDISWEKFKFEPDVPPGKIWATVPVNSGKFSNGRIHFSFEDAALMVRFPLIAGCGGSMISWEHVDNGEPVPYFVTLNDAKTNLVFAIGFKIEGTNAIISK